MKCLTGITQRGDHIWPWEWDAMLRAIAPGPYYTKFGHFLDGLKTPNQVVTDIAAAVGFPDNVSLYVWWCTYNPNVPSHQDYYLWTGAWNGFKGWRLSDLAHWVYPAASPDNNLSYPPIHAVTRPLIWGDIFIAGLP